MRQGDINPSNLLGTCLREKIRRQLAEATSPDGPLSGESDLRLVVLAGNGLSRIALASKDKDDQSYFGLVQELCSEAQLPPLDHLVASGYTLDEVFRLAITEAKSEKEELIFQTLLRLWKTTTQGFSPNAAISSLHTALAKHASGFLTTNYDTLIEFALAHPEVRRYREDHCPDVSVGRRHQSSRFEIIDSDSRAAFVYKIHGSFPLLRDNLKIPTRGEFNSYCNEATGADPKVIIEEHLYNYWALEADSDEFKKKFEGPLDVFGNNENLILVIGHALSYEERILFRIRDLVKGSNKAKARGINVMFETEPDRPKDRMGPSFASIRIPPGLAASSSRRELAYLLVLEAIAEYGLVRDSQRLLNTIQDLLSRRETQELQQVRPAITAFGQVALHTYRGIEDAPSQERAYSPKSASWKPGQPAHQHRPLESTEPFGDALVPCGIWDALAIPSALVGYVGCDERGRIVHRHLIRHARHLDFSKVRQMTEHDAATEGATVACWMDLRLILDSPRRMTPSQQEIIPLNKVISPEPNGRFVYFSKPGIDQVLADLKDHDLFVFDTGNNCNAREIVRVVKNPGVTIASALSAYLYFKLRCSDAFQAKLEDIDRAWKTAIDEYSAEGEPTDETGRYDQMSRVLKLLDVANFSRRKVLGERGWGRSCAFSVSLGPLGVLWWGRQHGDCAQWTRILPSEDLTTHERLAGQCLPFAEIRNGLGCGDAGRAGFQASLALSSATPREISQASPENESVSQAIEQAFRAMVWFGGSRVMFWSMLEFQSWLKQEAESIRANLENADSSRQTTRSLPFPDGVQREVVTHAVTGAARDQLIEVIDRWGTKILNPTREEISDDFGSQRRASEWVQAIDAWQKARGLDR